MKKLMFVFCLLTFFNVESVFADWSNAKYFQCAVTKRYTARAKLKPPGQTFYSWTYDGGCTYAQTDISSYAVNQTSNCGYAYSYRNSSGGTGSGWSQCGWSHGDYEDYAPAFFSFAPMKSVGVQRPQNDENYTYSGLSDKGIEFDPSSRMVTIDNLNGRLYVDSKDKMNSYSTFQIEIYTFKLEDETPVQESLLWKCKATIINGELYLEGDFRFDEFSKTPINNGDEYVISGVSKQFLLPEGIDIENVCVEISGDGGNFANGVSIKYAPNFESEQGQIFLEDLINQSNFDFTVFAHNGKATANINSNSERLIIEEISILSLSGQVLTILKIDDENQELALDISNLSKGVYLFMIRSGEQFFSKKFIN